MKWTTGFILVSLLRETFHQVITSRSSSSSSTSSSSSSTSRNGQQGFSNFAPGSSNIQHFNSFGNRPPNNLETKRVNQPPQSHQSNGVIKSESFTQNFGQTFGHPGRVTHISPPKPFQSNHDGQSMMQNVQGHQNRPQRQQMNGEHTDQHRRNAHHGQHWVQTASGQQVMNNQHPEELMNMHRPGQIMNNHNPEQLMNIHPPGQIMNNQHSEQPMNIQRPGQIMNNHNPEQLMNIHRPGQIMNNQHSEQPMNIQRPGQIMNNQQPEQLMNMHRPGQKINDQNPEHLMNIHHPGKIMNNQNPEQLVNIHQPGQNMNNQHSEQPMQELHRRHLLRNQQPGQKISEHHSGQQLLNKQHPAQHLLNEQNPAQHLLNEQNPAQHLLNEQHPGLHLFNEHNSAQDLLNKHHPGQQVLQNMHQGQQMKHQRPGSHEMINQEQQLRTHNFGSQMEFSGQQGQHTWFHNSGQQPKHDSSMQKMANNFQGNQLPNEQQREQNKNGESSQNLNHRQQNQGMIQGFHGQQSFNNHQVTNDQNKIPNLQGPHLNERQQRGPVLDNDIHHSFENFHSSKSHSFSTNTFGEPLHLQNTPQQFVKSVSSVSTSNVGSNKGNSFFKMPQFDRPLFPRNFIIPKRRRTNTDGMFPSMNNMNIPRSQEAFGREGSQNTVAPKQQLRNTEEISQTSSGNIFGFEPADRAQFGEGLFKPDQIQNMTFQTDVPFGNWDSQRWSSDPRDISFDIDFDLKVATCTEEYQKLPNHTMCLADKANLNVSGVPDSDQAEIVRLHNEFRGTVMPEASDIFTMKWDDRLAIVAQKWANQCSRHHDRMRTVPSLGKHTLIGQNLAGGFSNWSSVIKEWWTENVIWQYGIEPSTYIPETSDVAETIGHYIQMTYNATYLVGCGFAYCDNSQFEKYYVCNYAPGLRSFTHPFTIGERCKACPHWCRDGKCDCGGRVCNNGGTLNMRTCQCECGPLYAGPSCDILRCPFHDHPDCGVQYQKDHCVVLPKVNQDCPYMCGRCAQGHVLCGGRICFNGGVLKETTCQCSCSPPFTGETCEANCGDPDDAECQRWPNVFCHWNYQIQKRCPHRCNLCPTQ